MNELIEIFTDGACKGNPGPGGWGVLLRYGQHEKQLYGGERLTTNNRMELMAVIQALRALKRNSRISITTDSQYVKMVLPSGFTAGNATAGRRQRRKR